MATMETSMSKMKLEDESDHGSKKRKIEKTFGPNRSQKRRKPDQQKPIQASPPPPDVNNAFSHRLRISDIEWTPKIFKRTYIYLDAKHFTVGTKQLQELRLMFKDHVSGNASFKADRWGYYIVFNDNKRAIDKARQFFENFRFQRFEDKVMPMELFHQCQCVMRCHVDDNEFEEPGFVWVGDALLDSLG